MSRFAITLRGEFAPAALEELAGQIRDRPDGPWILPVGSTVSDLDAPRAIPPVYWRPADQLPRWFFAFCIGQSVALVGLALSVLALVLR